VSDKGLILAGYSGHGFVVAEAALTSGMDLKAYCEINKLSIDPFYLDYLGFEGDEKFIGWETEADYILGIGDNRIRHKVAHLILSKNRKIQNVIHTSASIARKTELGEGNFVARNVSVNPLAVINNFCILNTGCIVEHECVIEDAVHIAPGTVLAGNVFVGEKSFIGANSVVKQGVKIGKNVIVGAGSVVLNDIPDNEMWFGNPAKKKK
jgi:sugar O-acyltransferase (sialic acid O-acetyltransferase NeuD family)